MATLLGIGLIVLLAIACWAGLLLVLLAQRLARLRWRTVRARTMAREDIPTAHRQGMDVAGAQLEQLGFIYRYSASANKAVVLPDDEFSYFDVYQHTDGHSHVLVSLAPVPSAHDACMLQFITSFDDGCNWLTLNRCRHFSPMRIARWKVFDDYLPRWQQAWQRHLRRVQTARSPVLTDATVVQRRLYQSFEALISEVAARGDLAPIAGSPFFRLTWMAALRFAAIALAGQWRAAWALAGTPPPPSNNPEAAAAHRADADLRVFQEQMALRRSTTYSIRTQWLIFAVTAVLFLLVGGWTFSWSLVPILLAVIAIHEGGHYLAMKLTGHRNVAVFFLPGLGGVATGEKAHASPLEKLAVYLAGPVPGLLLAGVAFWLDSSGVWAGPAWLSQFLIVSLVINYFNLLPIVPLDGGRVLEALVFSRLPRLRLGFTLICCVALFGLGVMLEEMVLELVAVLLAFGLPQHWRLMQLDLAVRRETDGATPAADETRGLQDIFAALQAPRFQAWSFAKRAAAAGALLPELLGRKPRLGESVAGIAIYLACLLAPIAAVAVAVPNLSDVIAAVTPTFAIAADDVDAEPLPAQPPPEPDWEAQIANASALPKEQLLRAYLGAAGQANDVGNGTLARKQYLNAWELAQALPLRDPRRIDALEGLFSVAESDVERDGHANIILTELAQPQGSERARVAWIKEQQASGERNPAQRVQLLQDAVALRAEGAGAPATSASHASLHLTQLSLANALDANLDAAGAQAVLQQRIDSLALPEAADRSRQALEVRTRRVLAQVDLAWFFMGHGRRREAVVVAEQARQALPAKTTVSWIFPSLKVWEALVWAQLLAPPTTALARHWRSYEAAQRDALAGSRKLLYHEVDRALVAQALADAGMMAQAQAGIDEARAKLPGRARGTPTEPFMLCKPALKPEGYPNWRTPQHEARRRMLAQLGGCTPQ
ncbi:MAG: site-2 protease family protein [Candidatus Competibacter sp.]|nr:site-2 protease family protein [Candidatus Competibacter sp.]